MWKYTITFNTGLTHSFYSEDHSQSLFSDTGTQRFTCHNVAGAASFIEVVTANVLYMTKVRVGNDE
jgi:hypothetical protein